MENKQMEEIRKSVRNLYGKAAKRGVSNCGCSTEVSCCGDTSNQIERLSTTMGYSKEEVGSVPEGSNLGLGCGNPQAIASLKPGEIVLDLGSGGGFDCFLAAQKVGETGRVIGVDMTAEMLTQARANAEKMSANNVEFRLGEIEHLPTADASIDVIISNCVINLSPDKQSVFNDAFRVLKPGGRLAVSDVVATIPLPADIREKMALISACIGGAEEIETIEKRLQEAGFKDIKIRPVDDSRDLIREWIPNRKIENYIVSATIEAVKPG